MAGVTGKLYYTALLLLSCLSLAAIQPVCAAGQQPASLALQISPSSEVAGGTVRISTDVTANRFIKIGMLIYRISLSETDGQAHYLQPIIIRDFKMGSTQHTDTDYSVGNVTGDWKVSAYLCIGKCEVRGETPARNAAVTATGTFTVLNNSSPAPLPGSSPLQFPQ